MRHPLSERYHRFLKELGELHDRKQQDYGSDNDPFANVRASEKWGIPPWVGALMRAGDKMARLQNFARKRQLANESAQDSMRDIAVYMGIALVLYEEETATAEPEPVVGDHWPDRFIGEPHGDVQYHEHPSRYEGIVWHFHHAKDGEPLWREDQLAGPGSVFTPEPVPDVAGKDV